MKLINEQMLSLKKKWMAHMVNQQIIYSHIYNSVFKVSYIFISSKVISPSLSVFDFPNLHLPFKFIYFLGKYLLKRFTTKFYQHLYKNYGTLPK